VLIKEYTDYKSEVTHICNCCLTLYTYNCRPTTVEITHFELFVMNPPLIGGDIK